MKKLRLGVLGLGEGRSIISAATNSDLWEVAMICDLNEALCREMAEKFTLSSWTSSYEQMLSDPSIDVIGVYTPDHLHAAHIEAALRAGKHVICTKPLMMDLTEGRAILDLTKEKDLKVFVGQSTRFFSPMIHQRKAFEQGKLGVLATVEAAYNADHRWFMEKPWTASKAFKWLFGGLSHPLDLIRWYLPEIEEVMAYGDISANGRDCNLKNPDIIQVIVRAKDGRIARISGTYLCPLPPEERDSGMTCILRGSKGSSQADYHELRYAEHIEGESPAVYRFPEEEYYFRFGGTSHHAGEYQNYIEYFARCLQKGETPYPNAQEGLITVACLMAVDRSIQSGRPVKIEEILKEHRLEELI